MRGAGYGGYGWFRPARSYGGGYGYTRGGGGCGGCLGSLISLVVVLVLAAVLLPASCISSLKPGGSSGIVSSSSQAPVTPSTRRREKLPASACVESDSWISDRAEWLDNQDIVIKAMRQFYDKTGSQPYLVIATDVDGSTDFTDDEGEAWANRLYDERFSDEGHTLVAFVEYEESRYAYYIIVGSDATSVIDEEARTIIADEINYWYTDSSLDDNEYFAKVFRESANAIMSGGGLST